MGSAHTHFRYLLCNHDDAQTDWTISLCLLFNTAETGAGKGMAKVPVLLCYCNKKLNFPIILQWVSLTFTLAVELEPLGHEGLGAEVLWVVSEINMQGFVYIYWFLLAWSIFYFPKHLFRMTRQTISEGRGQLFDDTEYTVLCGRA